MQKHQTFEKDLLPTNAGDLGITFLGHGSLMLEFDGKVIHVDPYGRVADYAALPKADLVLLTHEHSDHLDPDALRKIRTEATEVVMTEACSDRVDGGVVLHNGDHRTAAGLEIDAVPAYNVVHHRDNGQPFHPKGRGNGYVIRFGDLRLYIGGDTENIPEMAELPEIDVAFLPMNLPYTMTPEMVADAAAKIRPGILYPYHFGSTDPQKLVALLDDDDGIEVRIRKMS